MHIGPSGEAGARPFAVEGRASGPGEVEHVKTGSETKKIYSVKELIIGDKSIGNKIEFRNVVDLDNAYRELNDGKDIYVEKDGIITLLPHRMICGKVYDGTLVLTAKKDETCEGRMVD